VRAFLQADAARLPFADGSVDLIIGSPPYADARTYGIGAQRKCQDWIDWMLQVTAEAVRVSRGLVLWVCAGVTRKHCYWPGPEGLLYEWWKRGGRCWRPAFWHRVGIPGSGGKQWLRADVEYVLAFTGCADYVPWADNTANGHPPKWAPGGDMSHRLSDGARVNQWGRVGSVSTNTRGEAPTTMRGTPRPSHKLTSKKEKKAVGYATSGSKNGDTINGDGYLPPVLANPGCLIKGELTLAELISILSHYEQACTSPGASLRELRTADSAGRLREWFYGVCLQVRATTLLQHSLRNQAVCQERAHQNVRGVRQGNSEAQERTAPGIPDEEILRSQVPGTSSVVAERADARRIAAPGKEDCQKNDAASGVRKVWIDDTSARAPQGRGCNQQSSEQSSSLVHDVPSCDSQTRRLQSSELHLAVQGNGLLQSSLPALQEVWHAVLEVLGQERPQDSSNLITGIKVGGGMMGHQLAHVNEAPYPVRLAEWFIRGWCPPGGLCLDPFSGSGTTCAAAIALGRHGIGCDLRFSQVALSARRCAEVQPGLLG
jgi:hypothetical protein